MLHAVPLVYKACVRSCCGHEGAIGAEGCGFWELRQGQLGGGPEAACEVVG